MRWLPLLVAVLSAGAQAQSIVVAPFANRTPDQNLDWVGESISETVREALASEGLPVIKREDRQEALAKLSLPLSGQMSLASVIKLGEELEAAYAIHGEFSFQPAEADGPSRGSLRIEARVLDLKRTLRMSQFSEVGALEDLATLQSDVAFRALKAFRPEGGLTREQFDQRRPPVKVSAIESYIRGLMAPTPEVQHRFFTQAVRLDASLWQPCYYLGRMQWEKENYREAIGWLEKVGDDTPYSDEATFMLGLSRYHTGDFDGARQAFEKMETREPRIEVFNNLGAVMVRLGLDGALDQLNKALDADSGDPDVLFNIGYALWRRGDFEVAADRFRAVLDREQDDQDAILLLGRCLKQSGPRQGDLRTEGLERLKESLEDRSGIADN